MLAFKNGYLHKTFKVSFRVFPWEVMMFLSEIVFIFILGKAGAVDASEK